MKEQIILLWNDDENTDLIRNKFLFSGVHGRMNAMGQVQSNSGIVTLILQGTHCVHTSMNLGKMKFISYIYIILGMFSINYN